MMKTLRYLKKNDNRDYNLLFFVVIHHKDIKRI